MKYITLILFLIIIISCNSKTESFDETDDMYNILCGEFEDDFYYISNKLDNRIKSEIIDSIDFKTILLYNEFTKEYIKFIDEVESEFMNTNISPFFVDNSISELGKQYLIETDLYRNNILELIKDIDLREFIDLKLSTYNPQHRNGNDIPHIEYYFKGISKSGSLAYLKNKKRNVLLIENDFLTGLISKTKKL